MIIQYIVEQIKVNILVFIILILASIYGHSQDTLTAIVLDLHNKEPLPYVSVGIKNTIVGTLTDSTGLFTLPISSRYRKTGQLLTLTHLNYRSVTVPIFKDGIPDTIYLDQRSLNLPIVNIASKSFGKKNVFGNDRNKTAATFRFSSNNLGTELGSTINTNGDSILVKSLNFNIFRNDFPCVNFRVHLYELRRSDTLLNTRDLIKENIVVEFTRSAGILSVDLILQSIVLIPNQEYLVSIEWLENKGNDSNQLIQFAAGIGFKKNILYKHAVLSRWNEHTESYFGLHANLAFFLEGYKLPVKRVLSSTID